MLTVVHNDLTLNAAPNPRCCSQPHLLCSNCAALAGLGSNPMIVNASRAERRAGAAGMMPNVYDLIHQEDAEPVSNAAGGGSKASPSKSSGRQRSSFGGPPVFIPGLEPDDE